MIFGDRYAGGMWAERSLVRYGDVRTVWESGCDRDDKELEEVAEILPQRNKKCVCERRSSSFNFFTKSEKKRAQKKSSSANCLFLEFSFK